MNSFSAMKFPVVGDLKIYFDAGVTRYLLTDPGWFNTLNKLYPWENLEEFKAEMLYNLFQTAAQFLDKVPASAKERYTELTKEIIAAYSKRLHDATWPSESTRTAALDKLDNLKIRDLYPGDWLYCRYGYVDYKDAGNFYDQSVQLRKHNQAELVKDATNEPCGKVWIKDMTNTDLILPQIVNTFYNPSDNSINILAGYVFDHLKNPPPSQETILAVADYYGGFKALSVTHLKGEQYTSEMVAPWEAWRSCWTWQRPKRISTIRNSSRGSQPTSSSRWVKKPTRISCSKTSIPWKCTVSMPASSSLTGSSKTMSAPVIYLAPEKCLSAW